MKSDDMRLDNAAIMPAHSPTYPAPPVFFEDVETQMVEFEADPDAVQAHLPPLLKADPRGRAVAVSLRVGQSSCGPFNEAGLYLGCLYQGQPAVFNSHLYLDNVAAITAGRELWGYPKEHAEISFSQHEAVKTCTVVRGGETIMRISTACDCPVEATELPSMDPLLNLKIIPRADGPGPALKQLLRSNNEAFGPSRQYGRSGTLELRSAPRSELASLAPCRILGGFLHIGSLREDYHTILHDYLNTKEDK